MVPKVREMDSENQAESTWQDLRRPQGGKQRPVAVATSRHCPVQWGSNAKTPLQVFRTRAAKTIARLHAGDVNICFCSLA